MLGLLKPWNKEESHSVRALRTNNSVTEEHIKFLIAQAKELSYKTAREAAIALLACAEPKYLLKMSRIYSLGHDGFHTLDDRMSILSVIKILNGTYENLQAYLVPIGNRPMPNVSIYILPIIFNVLDKKEGRACEDTLFKILEFIYSFERGVSYSIPDFNKEVILGSLRMAAIAKDGKTQDAACKLFHLLNRKLNSSSSAVQVSRLGGLGILPKALNGQLFGVSSSLDEEVDFSDGLGRISFGAQTKPQRMVLIKDGLESILNAMPENIIADLKLNVLAGKAKIEVIYKDKLELSGMLKNNDRICLNIGKDVLPKKSDNFDLLLLWDLLSEGIASLMLRDYSELKQASRTNENAYFKIGLVKALLNYKAYLPFYHKALYRQVWFPNNYWNRKTPNERQELEDRYLKALNENTSEMSGIYQGDIFCNVMGDDEAMFIITEYIHILSKNPLFNEDVIDNIINKISGLDVLKRVSLARIRNVYKEFFFNGIISLPAGGNTFEDRYFLNNFDHTSYVSGLKEILLAARERNVFYPGLRRLISYFLPLGEKDLDEEIEVLFKDDDKFFSPAREEAIKRAIGEIFIRRLGEKALRGVMKFLSGDRSLYSIPYLDILPITLNKDDNADDYGSLGNVSLADTGYNFFPGQENDEAVDWVSRLFLVLPKTGAGNDDYINSGSPLFKERDAYNSGSPVGSVKIKLLQDKYRKAKNLLTNDSFLNSMEIFEGMRNELKRAEKIRKTRFNRDNLKV